MCKGTDFWHSVQDVTADTLTFFQGRIIYIVKPKTPQSHPITTCDIENADVETGPSPTRSLKQTCGLRNPQDNVVTAPTW